MSNVPSAVIIPVITWAGITCFIIPFIFCCCRTYYKDHPNSRFTKYFLFPMIKTEKCLLGTYKKCKHKEGAVVQVNRTAVAVEEAETPPVLPSPVTTVETIDSPLCIPPGYSEVNQEKPPEYSESAVDIEAGLQAVQERFEV